MIVTRITIVLGIVLYVFLWILALHGATMLMPLLAVPLILVVLIGAGNLLENFMGIRRRGRGPDRDGE